MSIAIDVSESTREQPLLIGSVSFVGPSWDQLEFDLPAKADDDGSKTLEDGSAPRMLDTLLSVMAAAMMLTLGAWVVVDGLREIAYQLVSLGPAEALRAMAGM